MKTVPMHEAANLHTELKVEMGRQIELANIAKATPTVDEADVMNDATGSVAQAKTQTKRNSIQVLAAKSVSMYNSEDAETKELEDLLGAEEQAVGGQTTGKKHDAKRSSIDPDDASTKELEELLNEEEHENDSYVS
mmetsp:Transcript_55319/g.91872  ORF Transcript_55319/g.91872 Transcript_55319/m.91872 type:complete len:136 (+) Transcript_55319:133-540(+)